MRDDLAPLLLQIQAQYLAQTTLADELTQQVERLQQEVATLRAENAQLQTHQRTEMRSSLLSWDHNQNTHGLPELDTLDSAPKLQPSKAYDPLSGSPSATQHPTTISITSNAAMSKTREPMTTPLLKLQRKQLGIPDDAVHCHVPGCKRGPFQAPQSLLIHLGLFHTEGSVQCVDDVEITIFRNEDGLLPCPRCSVLFERMDMLAKHTGSCPGVIEGSPVSKSPPKRNVKVVQSKSVTPPKTEDAMNIRDVKSIMEEWEASDCFAPKPPFQCHMCGRRNLDKRKDLYLHLYNYHTDVIINGKVYHRTSDAKLKCGCGREVTFLNEFKKHVETCSGRDLMSDVLENALEGSSASFAVDYSVENGNEDVKGCRKRNAVLDDDRSCELADENHIKLAAYKKVKLEFEKGPEHVPRLVRYAFDDLGDLAVSESRITCKFGVFYNAIIRDLMEGYDALPIKQRALIKEGVRQVLRVINEDNSEAIYRVVLDASENETFVVSAANRAEFTSWIRDELGRCYPGVKLRE